MYVYSKEQAEIKKNINSLKDKIKIFGRENEEADEFINGAMKLIGKQGYLGVCVPEEFGGIVLDGGSAFAMLAEIAKVNPSLAHLVNGHNFAFCKKIARHGTDAQKEKYLPRMATGEKIGILAYNEPDGSNIDAIKLSARRDGDCYILNGTKSMITYAKNADYAMVFAKTGSENNLMSNFSYFIVDIKETPGISIGKTEKTMGMHGIQIGQIDFSDCRIPAENLFGKEGEGLNLLLKSMEDLRVGSAAIAYGIAETAYYEALKYCKNRLLNGKPLIQNVLINSEFADLYSKLKTMEISVFYTANQIDDENPDMFVSASVSKYCVTETSKYICDKALQLHGGYGYIKDFPIEQLYRDIRILTINGGSTEAIKTTMGDLISKGYVS